MEINLSSSALGHSNCILDLYRTVVQGYKTKAMPAKMIYGIGVHKYIEIMYLTGGHIPTAREQAIIAFASIPRIDDSKSMHLSDVNHMIAVALMTWELFVKQEVDFEVLILNDKPAVEQTFSEEIYRDEDNVFNWCGTIDRIGKKRNGIWLITDWKTTSSWNAKDHLSQYELKNSPRGYMLGLKLFAEKHPDSILGQISRQQIGARFDGIYVKPKINEVRFQSSDVFVYQPEEIDEFKEGVIKVCKDLSLAIKNNQFPKQGIVNGSCNKKYGKCDFWYVCKHNNPLIMDGLLKRDFDVKQFNPMHYND
jgi:hypothetical protein